MTKLRFTMQTLALSVFMMALASLANAQATRTWVSGVGDDVNPCSRTAPCKTWAGAISKTAAGGEIDALDPGGFGTLTITKSIMVDGTNGQGFGSTLNSGGINGFVINDSLSGAPNTIEVTLRNLSINGAGTTLGLNGIRILSHKHTTINNVTINNQSNRGIDISNTATGGSVYIKDTVIEDVGQAGIFATTTTGSVNVQLDNTVVRRASVGLDMSTNSRVVAKNSRFTQNTSHGVRTAGGSISFFDTCVMDSNGGDGIQVGAGTFVRITKNLITLNVGTGFNNAAAGTVVSYQDNRVIGNSVETSGGAPTPGTNF